MAKARTNFVCQNCGANHPRWMGRCTGCEAWNTVTEELPDRASSLVSLGSSARSKNRKKTRSSVRLADVRAEDAARFPSGISEFDRVVGGGLVPGGVILVGGDPGIGKSTLLMQVLASLSAKGVSTLYVTGEESAAQVALRAKRIGASGNVDDIQVLSTTELEDTMNAIANEKPAIVVIDSIQTMRTEGLTSAPGTVSQIRAVAADLVDLAKARGVCMILIGHVTKEGVIAGPKVLEHLVDTVISFEGDRTHAFRLLRSQKNRFGPTQEVGIFEMHEDGLREVPDPSSLLLAERPDNAAGSIIVPIAEGSRPMLVELQALVAPAVYGSARRVVSGVDGNRLAILLAVLERKAQIHILDHDVFASITGGVRVDERAVDLPLALAVVSSLRDRAVSDGLVAFGEVGLAGELRAVPRADLRLTEARKLGFRRAILPAGNMNPRLKTIEMEIHPARTLEDAIEFAFDGG